MNYNDKIIFKSNISIALIIAIILTFLTFSLFIGAIINSIKIGMLLISIVYFYLLTYSDKYTFIATKFWEDKIEIYYPLHKSNRKIVLTYPELEYLFFRHGYASPVIILIYKDINHKAKEVVIDCAQPYYIKKLINHALRCGVKSGIDINSPDYLGIKSSLPIIKIDKKL